MKFFRISQIFILLIVPLGMLAPSGIGGGEYLPGKDAEDTVSVFIPLIQGAGSPAEDQIMDFIGQLGGAVKAIAIQGNYAYIGEGGVLKILDITSGIPVVIGKTDLLPAITYEIAVLDDYAYLFLAGDGLRVVDVSDKSGPVEVGFYPISEYISDIAASGTYVYLAGNRLHIIDVSDPANPVEVSQYRTSDDEMNVKVVGNYAFLGINSDMDIVDVSDPNNPSQVGFYDLQGGSRDMAVEGSYLYVAGYAGVEVINISDPINPSQVGYQWLPYSAESIAVVNNIAYVVEDVCDEFSDCTSQLSVFDVSNPFDPTQIGSYLPGNEIYQVRVTAGYAYLIGAPPGAFRVVEISDPANPSEVGVYLAPDMVSRVKIEGDYAYLDNWRELWIVDISDPAAPEASGYLSMPYGLRDLEVEEDYVYSLDIDCEPDPCSPGEYPNISLTDISDPENPHRIGSIDIAHSIADFAVAGNFAYLAADWEFYVIDISDPAHPVEVGMVVTPSQSQAVVVEGNYAYVADWWGGLRIIDISEPTNPFEVGGYFPDHYATTVTVQENYAFLTGIWYGLWVIDISDPGNPYELSDVSIQPKSWGIGAQGDYVYITYEGIILKVIDISDPANPVEVRSRDLPDDSERGEVVGSFVILADDFGGMLILKYTGVRDAATLTIGSDHPNPSLVGEPFTVMLTMDAEFGLPSGEVVVSVEGEEATCSTALEDGIARCQITLDAMGIYTLTATYNGDNYFLPSSATATHVVVTVLPTMFYLPWVGGK